MSEQILCKPLDLQYINTVAELAQENYDLERQFVNALLHIDNTPFYHSRIKNLIENGIGRIAFQNGKIVGFLAFGQIYDKYEGVKGCGSPLYGYGIRGENRGKVIGHLFQSVAAELCEKYAQNLRVSVYAHDTHVLKAYIMSAFTMETTDVIRSTSEKIPAAADSKFVFAELNKTQITEYKTDIIDLYRSLINHLRVSPVFYHCKGFLPIEDRFEDFMSDDIRIFAVFDGNRLIGMIDSEPTDIDFAQDDANAVGMGDVFINPNYRGCGLGTGLLNYANQKVRESGANRIFVTHGTVNPTAREFWDKYLTNYSYTMTRHIDPEMLGTIELY